MLVREAYGIQRSARVNQSFAIFQFPQIGIAVCVAQCARVGGTVITMRTFAKLRSVCVAQCARVLGTIVTLRTCAKLRSVCVMHAPQIGGSFAVVRSFAYALRIGIAQCPRIRMAIARTPAATFTMGLRVLHRAADRITFAIANLVLDRRPVLAILQRAYAAGTIFLVTQCARFRIRSFDRLFLFPVLVLGDRLDRRSAPEYLCFFFR